MGRFDVAEMAKMVARQSLQTGNFTGPRSAWESFAGVSPAAPPAAPGLLVQTPVAAPAATQAPVNPDDDEATRRARTASPSRNLILGASVADDNKLGGP